MLSDDPDRLRRLLFQPTTSPKAWLYGATVAAYRANGVRVPVGWLQRSSNGKRTTIGGLNPGHLLPALKLRNTGEPVDEDQLRRSTLFGFYGQGLAQPLAHRWAQQLLAHGSTATFRFHRQTSFASSVLKWCRICAANDEAKGWQVAWHTNHQIPYLHHCLEDREPLLSRCGACGMPLDRGWQQRLPGDDCPACGSSGFIGYEGDLPAGYWGVFELASWLHRQEIHVRADTWKAVREAVVARIGREGPMAEVLQAQVLSRWVARDADDIRGILGVPSLAIDPTDASSADHSPTLVERFIFLDAMLSSGMCTLEPFRLESGRDALADAEEAFLADVDRSIKAEELPLDLGRDFLRGMGAKAICTKHAIPMRRLHRWRDSLAKDLRAKVESVRFSAARDKSREPTGRAGKPTFRTTPAEQRLASHKSALLLLIGKGPGMTRTQLREASQVAFRYVARHDPHWIADHITHGAAAQVSETQARHRASAEAFFRANGRTRAQFKRANTGAEAWLIRNDKEWFMALLARRA